MADKKLLYIINHMDWFWSHRLPLAQGAQNDGWAVQVCASDAAHDQALSEQGFTGFELPDAGAKLSPFAVLGIIFAIHRLIKTQKPDLVHAITIKYAFMAGIAARFHPNTKVVFTLAGLGYLFSGEGFKPRLLRFIVGPFLRFALKNPHAQVIFQNPDDQNIMLKRGFVRPIASNLIKGSGVDVDAFAFSAEPQNDTPIVVMPTRLVHDKGVGVFVEAARILKDKGINASFQIAGGEAPHNPLGISRSEMEAMISDGCAQWLGKVDDMPALLASANLIVYPSYYGEGIPKVLLESAAIGRAIITTDHAGCREAAATGVNGLLVPIKDAKATAQAIEHLLNDEALRAEMGAASRKRAENEFDVRIIVKTTLSVYNTALVS